jgi:hypothetical protein
VRGAKGLDEFVCLELSGRLLVSTPTQIQWTLEAHLNSGTWKLHDTKKQVCNKSFF